MSYHPLSTDDSEEGGIHSPSRAGFRGSHVGTLPRLGEAVINQLRNKRSTWLFLVLALCASPWLAVYLTGPSMAIASVASRPVILVLSNDMPSCATRLAQLSQQACADEFQLSCIECVVDGVDMCLKGRPGLGPRVSASLASALDAGATVVKIDDDVLVDTCRLSQLLASVPRDKKAYAMGQTYVTGDGRPYFNGPAIVLKGVTVHPLTGSGDDKKISWDFPDALDVCDISAELCDAANLGLLGRGCEVTFSHKQCFTGRVATCPNAWGKARATAWNTMGEVRNATKNAPVAQVGIIAIADLLHKAGIELATS